MISDFVKGSAKFSFPALIQKGIALHRQIDIYTDQHPVVQEAKEIFRPAYRLYSAPITDVLFDHFLANDPMNFEPEALKPFTQRVYAVLDSHALHLPPHFAQVLVYMKAENWLFHYSEKEGMRKSLRGLVRRATYLYESETAFQLFLANYNGLQQLYGEFFPDVKSFAKQAFEEQLK